MSLKRVKNKQNSQWAGESQTERNVKMAVYLEANWPYRETEVSQIAEYTCDVIIGYFNKVFWNGTMASHCCNF